MRRLTLYVIGLALVVAAAAAIWLAARQSKNHVDKTTGPTAAQQPVAKTNMACQIFTAADAKALLGSSAQGGPGPVESSPDLAVSSCSYSQSGGSGAGVSARESASLLVRAPKTDRGRTSNVNALGPLRPSGVEDVSGYGDSAYWDGQHGQLNILKNNNWYVLSYGSAAPANRSLDQAKQLADKLLARM